MVEKAKSFFGFFGLGEYPPEFNPKVHGPYVPSRNYGKRELSFVYFCSTQLCCHWLLQGH